jgi:hypothetical protein
MHSHLAEVVSGARGIGWRAQGRLGGTIGLVLRGVVRWHDRQLCQTLWRVSSHAAEVVAEARLHKGACGWVERLPWRAQHVMDDRRRNIRCRLAGCLALQAQPLLAAGRTLAAAAAVLAARAGALQNTCCWPGVLLCCIVRLGDDVLVHIVFVLLRLLMDMVSLVVVGAH